MRISSAMALKHYALIKQTDFIDGWLVGRLGVT
jgi:hypothetical protein